MAAEDRDLRSHSLTALLLRNWIRIMPNAGSVRPGYWTSSMPRPATPLPLCDGLPADVFGPEDGAAALQAARELLDWASDQLP